MTVLVLERVIEYARRSFTVLVVLVVVLVARRSFTTHPQIHCQMKNPQQIAQACVEIFQTKQYICIIIIVQFSVLFPPTIQNA